MSFEDASKYPLDFSKIEKGHVISVETIEEIFCKKRTDEDFWCIVLDLAEDIKTYFYQEYGLIVTTRSRKNSLIVCTDEEASIVNEERFRKYLNGLAKANRGMQGVVLANLSSDRLIRHQRELVVQSRYLQAINETRKTIRIESVSEQRKRSKLPKAN